MSDQPNEINSESDNPGDGVFTREQVNLDKVSQVAVNQILLDMARSEADQNATN